MTQQTETLILLKSHRILLKKTWHDITYGSCEVSSLQRTNEDTRWILMTFTSYIAKICRIQLYSINLAKLGQEKKLIQLKSLQGVTTGFKTNINQSLKFWRSIVYKKRKRIQSEAQKKWIRCLNITNVRYKAWSSWNCRTVLSI